MVLLVYQGLEAFRLFSNTVLVEFGGHGCNEMCNIMIVSRIILPRKGPVSYLAAPEEVDSDGPRMRQILNLKRSRVVVAITVTSNFPIVHYINTSLC